MVGLRVGVAVRVEGRRRHREVEHLDVGVRGGCEDLGARRLEGRRQHRGDQDRRLDVVVAVAAGPEGQLPDQQGHGEPDAGQGGQPDDVQPREVVVEFGAGEASQQPGAPGDTEQLAQHERDDDADRHQQPHQEHASHSHYGTYCNDPAKPFHVDLLKNKSHLFKIKNNLNL